MPHLVHVFPSFGPGGSQVRTVQVINSAPERYRHTVVALDGDLGCADRVAREVEFECIDFPWEATGEFRLTGLGGLLSDLRPDLLLTYNWGAVEAIVAGRTCGIARILHAEDGFNDDEVGGQKRRRVLARRLLLRAVSRVVVPSRTLERVARRTWWVPHQNLVRIPNGVDLAHFSPPTPDERRVVRARLGIADDDWVAGSVSGMGANKNVEVLVRAFARLDGGDGPGRPCPRLLLVGDGPRRRFLEELTRSLGVADRVVFAGAVDDPVDHYRAMDVFALTSKTEQMPLSVLEAMAVGLPVVSTDVGDVASMVAPEGAGLLVDPGNGDGVGALVGAVAEVLEGLRRDPEKGRRLGRVNRRRSLRQYDLTSATARYRRLYREVLDG